MFIWSSVGVSKSIPAWTPQKSCKQNKKCQGPLRGMWSPNTLCMTLKNTLISLMCSHYIIGLLLVVVVGWLKAKMWFKKTFSCIFKHYQCCLSAVNYMKPHAVFVYVLLLLPLTVRLSFFAIPLLWLLVVCHFLNVCLNLNEDCVDIYFFFNERHSFFTLSFSGWYYLNILIWSEVVSYDNQI